MELIRINQEHDINRNKDYQEWLDMLLPQKTSIKTLVNHIFSAGQMFTMKYSIRHDKECIQKEEQYKNKIIELKQQQQDQLYAELIKLKQENIDLKQAIKKHNIRAIITKTSKFYKGEDREII